MDARRHETVRRDPGRWPHVQLQVADHGPPVTPTAMAPHRRTLRTLVAGPMLAAFGVTALAGCAGSADDAVSSSTR
jgi:hypothetical protein